MSVRITYRGNPGSYTEQPEPVEGVFHVEPGTFDCGVSGDVDVASWDGVEWSFPCECGEDHTVESDETGDEF